MTDLERKFAGIKRTAEKLYEYIDKEFPPDWRYLEVRVLAQELVSAITRVDLSGPAQPIIPVRALEMKKEYASKAGFPVVQMAVRDDWDGATEWPS